MKYFAAMNPRIRNWREKRVWIIGGSTGIGEALARELHDRGARVAVSARSSATLASLAASCPGMLPVAMDAGKLEDWRRGFAQVSEQFAGLDLMVLCAATYRPQRTWETDAADAAETINVNLSSAYRGIECVMPTFLEQGSGGIAIVASVAGYVGLPNATVYGPTKAALINLAEILYQDLRPRGIGVYLVNPGFVRTRLTTLNEFPMPMLQTPAQAAAAIIAGFERGAFEIHFPALFTVALKWLASLPYRLRFMILRKVIGT